MFILPTFYKQLVDMRFLLFVTFLCLKFVLLFIALKERNLLKKLLKFFLWNGHRFQTLFFSYQLFSLLSLSVSKFWKRCLLYEIDKLSGKKSTKQKRLIKLTLWSFNIAFSSLAFAKNLLKKFFCQTIFFCFIRRRKRWENFDVRLSLRTKTFILLIKVIKPVTTQVNLECKLKLEIV